MSIKGRIFRIMVVGVIFSLTLVRVLTCHPESVIARVALESFLKRVDDKNGDRWIHNLSKEGKEYYVVIEMR